MSMLLSSSSSSSSLFSVLNTPSNNVIEKWRPIFRIHTRGSKIFPTCLFKTSVCYSFPPSSTKRAYSDDTSSSSSFIVVNFYRFVFIQDPHDLVSTHLSFLKGLDIRGRIYLNEQGINAQFSGPSVDALMYLEWIKEDSRFSDILVQISPSVNGHSFPRLKLRYKPSLVQASYTSAKLFPFLYVSDLHLFTVSTLGFTSASASLMSDTELEGGISHLPLLDPSMRATPLAPSEWRNRLQAASSLNLNNKAIVLDVRNGYEWDIGHFHGAQRPDVDCFRSTSFGLSESELIDSDPLANVDKEKTDILMYCTGGIRCDIYSSILRERGFQNLFTLKGGVSHYLEKEGPVKWIGNLFVFDSRLSLPPSTYKPEAVSNRDKPHLVCDDSNFARCYICQSHLSELRHRNCANIDCNRLFLCCSTCLMEVCGCCCLDCTCAPRLRPILSRHQRYEKWHIYRDQKVPNESVV
ncbi:hypothetical protein IFM89_039706 [Coptis chinensis]|uniref:Rhodanese domain-containing protein n=1 Tax=Coptis chinensis TaxID=261450 RepID=A0A835LAC7_9MAGN|nr:hypothetical protein IFM89_039706 [Coptis chinensis]